MARNNVCLDSATLRHAQLGAALHGMTLNDYFNLVVSRWIVAANGVVISQPAREGTPALNALVNIPLTIPRKK